MRCGVFAYINGCLFFLINVVTIIRVYSGVNSRFMLAVCSPKAGTLLKVAEGCTDGGKGTCTVFPVELW